MTNSPKKLAGPVAAVLVAALLRFTSFNHLPPGIFYDESANGVDALAVLGGFHPIFFSGDFGREPLIIYLQAASIGALGPSSFALRLPDAFLGILTVAATFAAFRALAGYSVGLIGSLLLALLYWHVSLSRLGFSAVGVPVFIAFATFWLVKATRTGRPVHFALAGAFVGLDLYTYLAARLVPLMFACWFVGFLLVPAGRRCSARRMLIGGLLAAVVFALVVSPLAWYFATHPEDAVKRAGVVLTTARDLPSLADSFLQAGRALVWDGDQNPRHSLPGRALLGIAVLAGAAASVVTLRPWGRGPAAFLVVWSVAMLAPAALTDQPAHALRLVGELPLVLCLPAIGLDAVRRFRVLGSRAVGPAAVAVLLGLQGLMTARDYFIVWPARPDVYDAFDVSLLPARSLMSQIPATSPVMLSSETYEGMSIPLAVSSYVRPNLRTFDGREVFVAPVSPSGPGYVVYPAPHVPPGDRLAALGLRPALTAYDPFGRVADELYRVNPTDAFPKPGRPLAATISRAVAVEGADEQAVVHPGDWVLFTLYWRVTGALPPGDWLFYADLIDREDHHPVAESNNMGFPPDQWRSGDRVASWFVLPIPDDAPPTVGDVAIGIFDPDTGQHLPIADPRGRPAGDALYVGPVRVDRPTKVSPPEHRLGARFGDGITLAGYDLKPADNGPLTLSLHWQIDRALPDDYTVFVHVLDSAGRVIAYGDSQPGRGSLPTSTWVPGESILDVHPIALPPGSPPPARIEAGIYLLATGQRLPVVGTPGDSVTIAVPITMLSLPSDVTSR